MLKKLRSYSYSLYSGKLSFFVRSIGHFRLDRDSREPSKDADFGEIFWCIAGAGRFSLGEKTWILHPDQVWYYPPGSHQDHRPEKDGFEYRWLCIEGPQAAMLFQGLGIVPGIQNACRCPEDLFMRIERSITATAVEKRLETLADAFRILTLAAGGRPQRRNSNLMEEVREFINQKFRSPDLTVEALAGHFHLHRVVLNRKFKAVYNIPVSDYIISKRIYEADRLLKDSCLSLAEIAACCGFSSAGYFNKVIRRTLGISPGRLRARE